MNTTNTHPLDASADAAREALIRIGEERDARAREEAAEVAPIVAQLTPAQKRALLDGQYRDTVLATERTMRVLARHGLVRNEAATGVGADVWGEITPLGGKVYRSLRRANR